MLVHSGNHLFRSCRSFVFVTSSGGGGGGVVTLMAMLLDSVAPLVKMISLGSAPITSATCCSRARRPSLRTYSRRNAPVQPRTHLSCGLHCGLTLPAIGVCSGVRVTIVIHLVGQHGVQHTWVLQIKTGTIKYLCPTTSSSQQHGCHGYHRRRGLEVHVERAKLIFLQFLLLYQI